MRRRHSARIYLTLAVFMAVASGCDEEPVAPEYGTLTINPEPNSINAPWQVAGPNGFAQAGAGDMTLANVTTGNYTVTWAGVPGWTAPIPASITQTLAAKGSLMFMGNYTLATGSVAIDVEPDSLGVPWELVGPYDYSLAGNGDITIPNLAVGEYTLTWGFVADWASPIPSAVTQTLAASGALVFSATYVPQFGTIAINPEPDGINAPWAITGPDGFSRQGSGDATLTSTAFGTYALTWGDVEGWTRTGLALDTQTLNLGGLVTFAGEYVANGRFVTLPPGTFMMGSPTTEHGRSADETQHQVTLTHGLYVQATEVTNQQYMDWAQWAYDHGFVTATTSGLYDNLDGGNRLLKQLGVQYYEISFSAGVFSCINPTHPVKYVTWYGAATYCDWLSQREGLLQAYNHSTWECNSGDPYTATGYRLPTEAEWEYACRAGTQTPFNTGGCLDAGTEANYQGAVPYTNCPSGPYVGWTTPVGSYPANAYGLYDLHGNLSEWCNDEYGTYGGSATNPVGAGGTGASSRRVVRGGSSGSNAVYCRSAARAFRLPYDEGLSVGFRPVRSIN